MEWKYMKHLLPAFSICLAVSILASCNPSGNSRVKIIGGTPVDETDPIAPHVAGLFDGHGSLSCTVAAISPSVFITAATAIDITIENGFDVFFMGHNPCFYTSKINPDTPDSTLSLCARIVSLSIDS